MFALGCGSGGGDDSGASFVAATIDGVAWRALGQGSRLTTATGEPSLTILGYTPLGFGSKQADDTKPMLELVFTGVVPEAGTYDVATTSSLTAMYMPDSTVLYGGDTGSVTIARITSAMADGTFAFVATAPGVSMALTVTDGSFRVPIGP
jgi:hypothetical protein